MAGMMINGKWHHNPDLNQQGEFERAPTTFRDRVSADGSSGFFAAANRYHLYVSLACPWAHRTLIMRSLKGLDRAISVAIAEPQMSDRGWTFSDATGEFPDRVNGVRYLQEIYLQADPKYTGRVTVPVLWDCQRQTIVNNESREIIRMFDLEFGEFATETSDLYPVELRETIDSTIDEISRSINAGVYRAGFTTIQTNYELAVTELFASLDRYETILGQQRYLCGNRLTAADVCLFPTLYRFDAVYYQLFKCNLRRICDYPNLWNYLKELYQIPAFAATCDLNYTKRAYYTSMTEIDPNQLIPLGPILDFQSPHDRDLKIPKLHAR